MGSGWLDWHLNGSLQVGCLLSLGINWCRKEQSLQSQQGLTHQNIRSTDNEEMGNTSVRVPLPAVNTELGASTLSVSHAYYHLTTCLVPSPVSGTPSPGFWEAEEGKSSGA